MIRVVAFFALILATVVSATSSYAQGMSARDGEAVFILIIVVVVAVFLIAQVSGTTDGKPAKSNLNLKAANPSDLKPGETKPGFMFAAGQLYSAIVSPAKKPLGEQAAAHQSPAVPFSEAAKPQQPFSDSGPVKGMALRTKRGERAGTLGKIIFTLDARIDMSAENRALIAKYKLGNRVIYDSANRRKYAEKAAGHLDESHNDTSIFDSPGRQAWGVAKTFARLGAAAVNATVSALSLRITVDSLMKGVHVECLDMNELLEAEDAILAAGLNLKAELETATTFTGQENVIEL